MTEEEQNQQSDSKEKSSTNEISSPAYPELISFVNHLDSLATAFPSVISLMKDACKESETKMFALLDTLKKKIDSNEGEGESSTQITVDFANLQTIKRYAYNLESVNAGKNIISQSFVLSLVSQYDFFLGRLLRFFYRRKPELLNATDKNLKYARLLEFDSMEEVKEFVLEKEVEGIIRKSHIEQLSSLEKIFDIELKKDPSLVSRFVEITERRNLFAHTNGIVSRQYLDICRLHKVEFESEPEIGKRLGVSREYFDDAYRCIFEIGVKLAQVLWRKLIPDDLNMADAILIDIVYELLIHERYDLAITLSDFSLKTLKKHSDENSRRVHVVNQALAYKWSGEDEKCLCIIKEHDWSACSDKFKLAMLVLSDNFEEAAQLMRKIGENGDVKKHDYQDWPLFKEFRKSDFFLNAHEDVFGRSFVILELPIASTGGISDVCERQNGVPNESAESGSCDEETE